jgi:hypothetical protein
MSEEAALLAAIARLHEQVDPVPEFVQDAARAAFAWRDPDAAVADVVADGLLTEAGVRATGGPRLLSFRSTELTVELEVHEAGAQRRVLGRLSPAGAGRLRALVGDLEGDVTPDERGRFVLDGLPAGPFRLRWAPADGTSVVTSWIIL